MSSPSRFENNPRMFRLGFVCLLAFNVVNFIVRRWTAIPWLDWVDGGSGLLLGAAIGLLLLAARSNRLRHRTSEGEAGPCR